MVLSLKEFVDNINENLDKEKYYNIKLEVTVNWNGEGTKIYLIAVDGIIRYPDYEMDVGKVNPDKSFVSKVKVKLPEKNEYMALEFLELLKDFHLGDYVYNLNNMRIYMYDEYGRKEYKKMDDVSKFTVERIASSNIELRAN